MTSPTDDLELTSTAAEPMQRWFPMFIRAVKACRFYPDGSSARERQVQAAYASLAEILRGQPEARFDVRGGLLFSGTDRIQTDPEKDGLARILFGSSIFQLSILDGITYSEFTDLVRTLSIDFSDKDHAGEDLVTALWRLDLQHIRYRYLDIFTASIRLEDARSDFLTEAPDDEETKRLKQRMGRIVSAMSFDRARGLDLVALEANALETPAEIRDEALRADNSFEIAGELFKRTLPADKLSALPKDLAAQNEHRDLAAHLVGLLIDALRSEERPSDPSPALDFLLRLFEGMIESAQFEEATKLVVRLQDIARRSQKPNEQAFAQRLLARFSSEHHVAKAIETLNAVDRSTAVMKIIGYLRALDHYAASALISKIDQVADPLAREMACELLLEITQVQREVLAASLPSFRWEVACELLSRSRAVHPDERLDIMLRGLAHPHPKVRVEALRQLRTADRGAPDEAIARAIHDRDPIVRMTALKIAGARKSPEALREITMSLVREDLGDHDPREVKAIAIAYASIAGERAVSDLARLLEQSGSIIHRKRTTTIRAAAAAGLKTLRSETARAVLDKGARSLNLGVRAACKAALEEQDALPLESTALPPVQPPPPLFIRTDGRSTRTPPPTIARTIGRGMHLLAAPTAVPLSSPPEPTPELSESDTMYTRDALPRLPSSALQPFISEEDK